MSLGGLFRRVGYKIKDSILNPPESRIHSQWDEIKKVLSDYGSGWPWVEQALTNCLKRASDKCPYYKPYAGKPLSEYPVTNKIGFIDNFDNVRNPDYPDSSVRPISTSGSTGTPFRVVQNFAKRNRVLAELQYFGELAGYKSHEKGIFFRACHPAPLNRMFWSNVWTYDIANMSDTKMENLYKLQARGNLQMTLAYASTYDILTSYWLKKGYVGNPNMIACISGSEILGDDVRRRCQEFWPKCKVYSRYSNMENGILAQERNVPNNFFINWASYYFEILKLDSDEPAGENELGRIVVTDMFNKAFPMIRYDTGDLGKMSFSEGEWPILSSVEGRRIDIIYDDKGSIVSPHSLGTGLWGLEAIRQWQFHQDGEWEYRITYVTEEDENKALASLNGRLDILHRIFGPNARFSFVRVNDIPQTASYKHKMVVQNWKRT